MNFQIIRKILGKIMVLVGILMTLPLLICLIYKESFNNYLSFIIPMIILFGFGLLLSNLKINNSSLGVKEGLVIVGLSWIIMSLIGSIPFMISGVLPNFFDAFFEMSSGFTTTGASVIDYPELLIESNHSIFLWRSFSHWIGGMGILVFILAIIPESDNGASLHILQAESPGPSVGKISSKMKATSRILYLIYISFTIIEFILLALDKDISWYDSLIYSFGTAGTGGFGIISSSIATLSIYSQYVISIFMIIFGINFTLYYYLLIGKVKDAIKSEELHIYFLTIIFSIIIIMLQVNKLYSSFEETFRTSLFQVSSIISTTGYSTVDYSTWPALSQLIIVILMFMGSTAGSTAGGLKISRVTILIKSVFKRIKNSFNPRKVETISLDKKPISQEMEHSVISYFLVYIFILIICTALISFDGNDLLTNFTASLSCLSNIGPGLGKISPSYSFGILGANYSNFSKLILSIEMIAGRLELIPIIILFSPKTWTKRMQ